MNLFDLAQTLRQRLARVEEAQHLKQDLAALQARRKDWDGIQKKVPALRDRRWFLAQDAEAQLAFKTGNAEITHLLREVRACLQEHGVQALTEDTLWVRTLASANGVLDKAQLAIQAQWQGIRNELGAPRSPEELDRLMLRTPENRTRLSEYRSFYEDYRRLLGPTAPAEAAVLPRLKAMLDQMRTLREGLELSATEAVRLFLAAAETGGAALDLLTPEVMAWLREHDDSARFVIRTRGGY